MSELIRPPDDGDLDIDESLDVDWTLPLVYFAGGVRHHGGYRGPLLGNGRVMSDGYRAYSLPFRAQAPAGRPSEVRFMYVGPFAVSDDHGCFHAHGNKHGCSYAWNGCQSTGFFTDFPPDGFPQSFEERADAAQVKLEAPPAGYMDPDDDEDAETAIVSRCLSQIEWADVVVAHIDKLDAFATFSELGFASAMGKRILLTLSDSVAECTKYFASGSHKQPDFHGSGTKYIKDEFWFIRNLPRVRCAAFDPLTIGRFIQTFGRYSAQRRNAMNTPEEREKLRRLLQLSVGAGL